MEYIGTVKKQGSIVEILKEEILSGRIAGGTELTQNEIANALGVSRMPVREALIILEYQGLMERLPNNHVRVAEFSEDYFKKIFHFCAKLEKMELKQCEGNAGDVDELGFHRRICRGMRHSFLKKTLETMIEIYIVFAVNQDSIGASERFFLLQQAVQLYRVGNEKEAGCILEKYFDVLAAIVQKGRK
ncbi:MAG: GntR family transcriptional regulator [Brotaphodocola sp.]